MYVIYALFVDEQDDLLVKLKTEKVLDLIKLQSMLI